MSTIIINDLHLGVQRTGGTTPSSSQALSHYALRYYETLLEECAVKLNGSGTIIVNGDLTDKFDIPLADALETYRITSGFLQKNPTIDMVWALGNHDLSKDSSKLGTVQFLGGLLAQQGVQLVSAPTLLGAFYIIPHLVNQEAFDKALDDVPEGVKYLLLHCNYDNNFAAQADHSLNLSREQSSRLVKQGTRIILGHEHQGRTAFGGKLIVVGNQFPTSVADCLRKGDAQADGKKYMLLIEDGEITQLETWAPDQSFAEVPWQKLNTVKPDAQFIRVTGEAQAEESAEVVRAIAELRKGHNAFVITNAVQVGEQDAGAVETALEALEGMSVLKLLQEMLSKDQWKVVEGLLATAVEE